MLLYGMQSSGASVLAFTLAQKPGSLAFVDIWNMFAAPELAAGSLDVVAKVVVTTAYSLETHRRRFRPDVTILVLRHPADTYDSLFGKSYAHESGLMDEKFASLEETFRAGAGFDHIAYYEDFVFSPGDVLALFESIGWKLGWDALLFRRTHREIEAANIAGFPEIESTLKYGAGNVQTGSVLRARVRFAEPWGRTAHLPRICPALFDHYAALRAERGELWHVPSRAILSCGLHAILRELTGSGPIPQHAERVGHELRSTRATPQSRITDSEVLLVPARGRQTRISIAALPGRPFNRLRCMACTEHPLACGTIATIGMEEADGKLLAHQEFILRHAGMRNFDLAFEPPDATLTLSIGVRLADDSISTAHAGVRFQNLRLEQVAD